MKDTNGTEVSRDFLPVTGTVKMKPKIRFLKRFVLRHVFASMLQILYLFQK